MPQINFIVDLKLLERLRDQAEKENRTVSGMIRNILMIYLTERGN